MKINVIMKVLCRSIFVIVEAWREVILPFCEWTNAWSGEHDLIDPL